MSSLELNNADPRTHPIGEMELLPAHDEPSTRRWGEKYFCVIVGGDALAIHCAHRVTRAPYWRTSEWQEATALEFLSPRARIAYLLSAWALYLARILGENQFQLGWVPTLSDYPPLLSTFFAQAVPMEIEINTQWCFSDVRAAVIAECAKLESNHTFASDLVGRHAQLRSVDVLRSQRIPVCSARRWNS
jgi:hypothetical protein